jgi:DNA-binding NtrC family response regulator
VFDPAEGITEQIDLRIVAATHEDPNRAVEQGRFRQDLLFRLQGFSVLLPSLRARPDDIALMMVRFLQDFSTLYETSPPELSEADISMLMAHDWPGNVRELRNIAERAVMMSKQGLGSVQEALSGVSLDPASRAGLREAVAAFERQMISKAIKTHAGRMDETADALRIGRRTLNEKIVKLGLDKGALL